MSDITTVNIRQDYLAKLGILAKASKRSKTSQLEILIDEGMSRRELDD